MKNKYGLDDISFDDIAYEQYSKCQQEQCDKCLTEQDFYPPSDNRTLKSNVRNIAGGDNFADYCEYIFEVLDEEEYYD